MAQPKDIETAPPEPPSQEPAGRVEFDSRGNSVWRWARDVLDSTSILLKRLENKDLALEPTRKVPVISEKDAKRSTAKPGDSKAKASKEADAKSAARHPAMQRERPREGGGGFDPYNSR